MCALAAPVSAAFSATQTFDAVNGFEQDLLNSGDTFHHTFVVTGIQRGQASASSVTYQFYDQEIADRYYASCERFALLAMKDAGHYAFIVTTDGQYVTRCRLEKR
jgi:hypothetical protein